jgi:hypothetical protein
MQLAQLLMLTLPKTLTQTFEVRILSDTAFGSTDMLTWIKKQKTPAGVAELRYD